MANDSRLVELMFRGSEDTDDVVGVSEIEPLPVRLPPQEYAYVTGVSGANAAQTVVTPRDGRPKQVSYTLGHYSGAPTQTGVITYVLPASGAAFLTAVNTGAANALDTGYVPGAPLILGPGDQLQVVAPAAGGSLTSGVTIAWRYI
jgi:hypothetical protein